jgi:hypothetical protein
LKLLNTSLFALLYRGELERWQDGKEKIRSPWWDEMVEAVQTGVVREAAGCVYLFRARRV